jgi:outer membrane protein TolC
MRRIILGITFILLCISVAYANEPKSLALKEIIEKTFTTNSRLKASYHRWQAGQEAVIKKAALKDPVVTYTLFTEPIQTRTGKQTEAFSLRQQLPFPGKQKARLRLFRRQAKVLKNQYDIQLRNLVVQIKKIYADIWFLFKAIEVAKANSKTVSMIANYANSASNESGASVISVLRAQSQLAQVENDLLNFSELLQTKLAWLDAISGISSKKITATSILPEIFIPEKISILEKLAIEHRQELQLLAEEIRVSKARLQLANFENKPDFTIGYNLAKIGRRPDLAPGILKNEGKDVHAIVFSMNLPIWGDKNRSRINEARQLKLVAENNEKDLIRITKAEVHELFYSLKNQKRLVEIYSKTVIPQARLAIESAEAEINRGQQKATEMLEAQSVFYSMQLALFKAKADLFKTAAELEKVIGIPLNEETAK